MSRSSRWSCVPRLERLESRSLLVAGGFGGSIDFTDGLLSILGTNKNDQVSVVLEGDQLRVSLNKLEPQWFTATEVTQIEIDVGRGNDRVVIGPDVMASAWIIGGDGNDNLWGGGGNDVIQAGAGNDKADGGGGDDDVQGERGNDKVAGGDGNDVVDGGNGQDQVAGGLGDDELFGGAGHDRISGGEGNDHLEGGAGKDHLTGEGGDDELLGGDADDKLVGGDGNDLLDGGGGHDHLFAGAGDDEAHGGDGKDQIKGGDGNDTLWADAGHDQVWGEAGDDWLYGGDGNDKLRGGEGNDNLKGENGDDHLDGGAGDNLLDGDAGKNHLIHGTEFDFDSQPPEPPEPPQPPAPFFQPLVAPLFGMLTSGEADYRQQTTPLGLETFLQIFVNGAPAGLDLEVSCGIVLLGHLLTDSTGFGQLRLSSLAGELPSGFEPQSGHALLFVPVGTTDSIIAGVFVNG